MKIKTLLTALCLLLGAQTMAYSQPEAGSQPSTLNPQQAPPRKEIRHKLKQLTGNGLLPEHNAQFSIIDSQLSTRASGEYIMNEFPTTGEVRGVVILAAFADVPFSISNDSISQLLGNRYNADNYSEEININEYSAMYGQYLPLQVTIPGSARDYFRAQSFGQFVPSFDVIGPVTLSQKRSYYGSNNSSGNDKNTSAMIREACQKAYDMGLTDFTDYDNDGDGVVDFVYVVYAGSDEAQTGIEEAIWAKASSITLTLGNNMKIRRYACSGELVIDLPVVAGIGTFVHEFSHVLGLPDFYNTALKKDDPEDFTMDTWSVMDYGLYNAEGFVPCAYTAFERYSLGWIPMHTLDEPATMSIGTTDEERRGYRIFTADIDTASLITEDDTASFYLIETIRREGWNRYAPANGLLISEVTYDASAWRDNKVNANTSSHRYCIVPANNDYNYRTANKHLFGNTNHEFTLTSTPASRTQFGAAMDKPLTDIRYDKTTGKTTLHFRGGKPEAPDTPQNPDDTEIQNPEFKNQNSKLFHDLQGRPMAQPSKGIYIASGKKVMVR